MNIDKKVLYSTSVILIFVLFSALFIPNDSVVIIAAALSAAAAVMISYLIKKRAIHSINKQQILLIMSVIGILYLTLYYLSGIEMGFYRASRLFTVQVFFRFILPISIIIISIEIIRNILLAQNSKFSSTLSYVMGILSELLIGSGLAGKITFNRFMDIVAMILLPAVTANILYHYLSKRYGIYPNIAYRLIITLYAYIIPVVPAVPDSLFAFINVLLPLAIYFFIDLLYEKKKKTALDKNRGKVGHVIMGTVLVLMLSIVMLISCQFRYSALVIATGSMSGEINKGDAVVYEEYDEQLIHEGDVIVFDKDGRLTVHRVADIQNINGEIRYFTKGDANNEYDVGYITDSNIKGVVLFKISYIGYPSIWLRDLFK